MVGRKPVELLHGNEQFVFLCVLQDHVLTGRLALNLGRACEPADAMLDVDQVRADLQILQACCAAGPSAPGRTLLPGDAEYLRVREHHQPLNIIRREEEAIPQMPRHDGYTTALRTPGQPLYGPRVYGAFSGQIDEAVAVARENDRWHASSGAVGDCRPQAVGVGAGYRRREKRQSDGATRQVFRDSPW